jgi:hypothetical protein
MSHDGQDVLVRRVPQDAAETSVESATRQSPALRLGASQVFFNCEVNEKEY